jgi:hypothetical protein
MLIAAVAFSSKFWHWSVICKQLNLHCELNRPIKTPLKFLIFQTLFIASLGNASGADNANVS